MKNMVRVCMALMMVFAMVVPSFATDFVKSIEEKPVPDVIIAEIVDEDGNVIKELTDGDIIITPLVDIDDADIPQEAKDKLKDLYEDLLDGTIDLDDVDGLLEELKEYLGEEATSDDLTIRDLFDVTILNEDVLKLIEEGYKIKIVFDLDMDDDFLAVLDYLDELGMVYDVQVNDNGTVTVILDGPGPVVFLTAGQNMFADGEDIPATGDTANVMLWAGLGVTALAALAVLIVLGRRHSENEE